MDRRHRAFLTLAWVGSFLLGVPGVSSGQQPGPSPSATPWVQASPPPLPPGKPAPRPPAAGATQPPADLRREMERRRQQELASGTGPDVARALQGMTPEERQLFTRNLSLWRTLPPAEKQALRAQAVGDRIREEVEKAYRESGLALTPDQREVFGLRYRQERRHLEREMQERMNAERARRLPEIAERLKAEFAAKPLPLAPAPPSPAATP